MTGILAAAPALPLHTAGKYVAGAYIVFLALVLAYVAIMATRLSRTERDLAELRADLDAAADLSEGADLETDAVQRAAHDLELAGPQAGQHIDASGRALGTGRPARSSL
ncbi:MAG: hypothetical protein ACR2IP_09865 [Solirubrobacteraceae bacterium]